MIVIADRMRQERAMVGGERVGLVVVLLCLGVTNTQQWWGGRKLEVSVTNNLAASYHRSRSLLPLRALW